MPGWRIAAGDLRDAVWVSASPAIDHRRRPAAADDDENTAALRRLYRGTCTRSTRTRNPYKYIASDYSTRTVNYLRLRVLVPVPYEYRYLVLVPMTRLYSRKSTSSLRALMKCRRNLYIMQAEELPLIIVVVSSLDHRSDVGR